MALEHTTSQLVKICMVLQCNQVTFVRSEVLTAASTEMTVFWDVALYSLVEIDWCFKGAYCLHREDDVCHDDGGSKHLWNVNQFVPDYVVQHVRRQLPSSIILFVH
jgi:hypothetical protein